MKKIAMLACAAILVLAPAAVVTLAQQTKPASALPPAAGDAKATAMIEAKSGSGMKGHAQFLKDGGKVKFSIHIQGATPGEHAVHLHEKGDCSDPEGKSAGGHWNPTSEAHGKWGTSPFHHGDIGNIVGPDGKGSLNIETDLWTIGGNPGTDVIGKAVIVHAAPDDFKTQPTGNAGGRIGCGVVVAEGD
jgi:Cu-Zn family superoxide dismutase